MKYLIVIINVTFLCAIILCLGGCKEPIGKKIALDCLSQYNQISASINKLTIAEKYYFTLDFLKKMGAVELLADMETKKSEFISNEEASDVFLDLLLTKWTEMCVEQAPL